jgi:hypothetical protein
VAKKKGSPLKEGIVRGRIVTLGGAKVPFIPTVQAIDSSIADIKLYGRSWKAEVGDAVEEAPLERTIEGASTLSLDIKDSEHELLRSELLASPFDVELDGLGFRYKKLGYQGIGEPLELTFEDREVARLRIAKGARKAVRGKVTRAEFARRLVREVKPRRSPSSARSFTSSSRSRRRPQGRENQTRRTSPAADHGSRRRSQVTVKHAAADGTQIRTIERCLDTAKSLQRSREGDDRRRDVHHPGVDGGQELEPFQQNADWPGIPTTSRTRRSTSLKRAPTYPGGFLAWLAQEPLWEARRGHTGRSSAPGRPPGLSTRSVAQRGY